MTNCIIVITNHMPVQGILTSLSYYYRMESEVMAKKKYAQLCEKYIKQGFECVHDDKFGTIEEVDGEDYYTSFMDFCKTTSKGVKRAEVEYAVEPIK